MADAEPMIEQTPISIPHASVAPIAPEGFDDILSNEPRFLDPAYLRTEVIGWWLFTAGVFIVGLMAVIITSVAGAPGWVPWLCAGVLAVLTAILIIASVRMPHLTYKNSTYTVTPLGLEIRQGVFWRRVTNVPKSRVQHTDVVQGPVMRHFGLAALTIHTAGTELAAVTLQGLSHATALRIRDFLVHAESTEHGDGV